MGDLREKSPGLGDDAPPTLPIATGAGGYQELALEAPAHRRTFVVGGTLLLASPRPMGPAGLGEAGAILDEGQAGPTCSRALTVLEAHPAEEGPVTTEPTGAAKLVQAHPPDPRRLPGGWW